MSYICKGDIPKSCSKCPQRTLYHGISVCLAANKMKVSTSNKCRHDNCLLVEIPTPHGRLIDADELIKKLERHRDMCGDIEAQYGIDTAIRILRNIPTIIEAEMSE